jgi:YD repeat-containing protein
VIAIVQPLLAPYRIPFFNAVQDALSEDVAVILTRTHHRSRPWQVAWDDVRFRVERVRTWGPRVRTRTLDVSFGVGTCLRHLGPRAIVVPGWGLGASWAALAWARRHRVPAYAWIDSHEMSGIFRGTVSNGIRRAFLNSCRGAIVPGDLGRRFVERVRPGLPIWIVPISVDRPQLRRLEPSATGGALFVGELSLRKGVDVLLEAAQDLIREFGSLTLVGEGPLVSRARRVAAQVRGLRCEGFLDDEDLIQAFASSSVFLLPSRHDPWGLAAVEALVAGRPIVLGPGVGAGPDMQRMGGSAVALMSRLDSAILLQSAIAVRGHLVPPDVRDEFAPDASAARFIAALQSARSGGTHG